VGLERLNLNAVALEVKTVFVKRTVLAMGLKKRMFSRVKTVLEVYSLRCGQTILQAADAEVP
jgi:hypothetical protein